MSAGDTTLTITGNLTADPRAAVHRHRHHGRRVRRDRLPPYQRPGHRAVAGWRRAVPALLSLARPGRPRRRIPDQGHAGHRHRPPQATPVRNPRGRQAHRPLYRRRGPEPVAKVGHRQDRQDRPGRGRTLPTTVPTRGRPPRRTRTTTGRRSSLRRQRAARSLPGVRPSVLCGRAGRCPHPAPGSARHRPRKVLMCVITVRSLSPTAPPSRRRSRPAGRARARARPSCSWPWPKTPTG